MNSPLKIGTTKIENQIIFAVVGASIYHIWSIRNHATFSNKHITGKPIILQIKEHVRYRILQMNKISGKYTKYIGRSLQ